MKFAASTIAKIESHRANGFEIIIGNAPFLCKSKKYANRQCVRLAQTNDRMSGFSKRTVWAVM